MAYCIHCGKELFANAKFCTYCGKKVENLTVNTPIIEPVVEEPIKEENIEVAETPNINNEIEIVEVPEKQDKKVCRYCGKELDEGVKYCTGCGRKVDNEANEVKKPTLYNSFKKENVKENKKEFWQTPSFWLLFSGVVLYGLIFCMFCSIFYNRNIYIIINIFPVVLIAVSYGLSFKDVKKNIITKTVNKMILFTLIFITCILLAYIISYTTTYNIIYTTLIFGYCIIEYILSCKLVKEKVITKSTNFIILMILITYFLFKLGRLINMILMYGLLY